SAPKHLPNFPSRHLASLLVCLLCVSAFHFLLFPTASSFSSNRPKPVPISPSPHSPPMPPPSTSQRPPASLLPETGTGHTKSPPDQNTQSIPFQRTGFSPSASSKNPRKATALPKTSLKTPARSPTPASTFPIDPSRATTNPAP